MSALTLRLFHSPLRSRRAKRDPLAVITESLALQTADLEQPYREARLRWAADEMVRGAARWLHLDEHDYVMLHLAQHYPCIGGGMLWIRCGEPVHLEAAQRLATEAERELWDRSEPTEQAIAEYEPELIPYVSGRTRRC